MWINQYYQVNASEFREIFFSKKKRLLQLGEYTNIRKLQESHNQTEKKKTFLS